MNYVYFNLKIISVGLILLVILQLIFDNEAMNVDVQLGVTDQIPSSLQNSKEKHSRSSLNFPNRLQHSHIEPNNISPKPISISTTAPATTYIPRIATPEAYKPPKPMPSVNYDIDPLFRPPRSDKYLLPALVYGPNNQMQGLRSSITTALLLGRTLVVPEIYTHYTDNRKEGYGTSGFKYHYDFLDFIEFVPEVVDEIGLKWISLEDFIDKFNGTEINCTVNAHLLGHFIYTQYRILRRDDLNLNCLYENYTVKDKSYFMESHQFRRSKILEYFNEFNSDDYPVIVFPTYNPVAYPTNNDTENKFIFQHYKAIQFNKKQLEFSKLIMEDINVFPENRCSICIHIRPFPDEPECFAHYGDDWDNKPMECDKHLPPLSYFRDKIDEGIKNCDTKYFVKDPTIFIAYMPSLNTTTTIDRLKSLYKNVVVWNDLVESSSLPLNETSLSPIHRSFAEQGICIQTTYFAGTEVSSWTESVEIDRVIRSKDPDLIWQ